MCVKHRQYLKEYVATAILSIFQGTTSVEKVGQTVTTKELTIFF